MNKLKRQLFPHVAISAGITEIVWQVTSCSKIFEIGSLPPIHGKITTLPVGLGTLGPGRGSFKATCSQNGRPLDQIPFYGSMGNVSCRPALTHSRLMVFPFRSGRRKECTLVR
jgi:hypothetical protein